MELLTPSIDYIQSLTNLLQVDFSVLWVAWVTQFDDL